MQYTLENPALAATFKAVGDQLRLDILRVLRRASFGVQELAAIFDMPQPGMSHHLKVLSKLGLVTSRREGNSFFYRRPIIGNDSPLGPVLSALFEAIDQIEINGDIEQRIHKVHVARKESSKEFFSLFLKS